jgi:hypothetical protein
VERERQQPRKDLRYCLEVASPECPHWKAIPEIPPLEEVWAALVLVQLLEQRLGMELGVGGATSNPHPRNTVQCPIRKVEEFYDHLPHHDVMALSPAILSLGWMIPNRHNLGVGRCHLLKV